MLLRLRPSGRCVPGVAYGPALPVANMINEKEVTPVCFAERIENKLM
jgi:hypothetical protein